MLSRLTIVFLVAVLVPLVSISFGTETVIVTDISGEKSTGTLKRWSAEKLAIASTSEREFALEDVRSVVFERSSKNVAFGESSIRMSSGDQISARVVSVANDVLTVSWPVLGEAASSKIPLEHVVAMIFEWPATMTERLRLLADIETLPPGSDLVMLKNGNRSLGEFARLDAAFVELKGATSSLKLDRSRIRAIRLNPELTAVARQTGRRAIFTLSDGSRLTATNVELVDDALKLKSPGIGNVILPLDAIVACHLFGEQLIPVSDYEPSKIEFTPYLSTEWPLLRNANVRHGSLVLRGSEFTTGLGMHSRMAVTYDLRGNEREFQGIVGIDDIANGGGSAIFAVELDGHRVWTSPELTGKSTAMSLPKIGLRGGKQLTLLVDFGQYADVSDYADWCDAVLIVDRTR